MNSVTFRDWITKKYVEWRGDAVGRERTISDYAQWLGISQPVVSQWMSGSRMPKGHKSIRSLVAKYGKEAYDVLGLPVPEEADEFIDISPHTTEEAIEIIQRLARQYGIGVEIHRENEERG